MGQKPPGRLLMEEISRRRLMAGAAAVGISVTLPRFAAAQEEEKKLNFYNWDTYIGETTLEDFKDATGIDVTMSLFADNDELFARLREGNPGFDVIVPTDTYVERMILADMLMPLDKSLIPNFKNINPVFQDAAFDPGRKFSVPYMWGTIGLGYRKSRVKEPLKSWKTVFDSDEYSGRIAWLSEAVTMIGVGAKYLGYSYNTTDPKQIGEVEQLFIKQKPNIKVIAPDTGQDLLLSGEVDIAVEWNGDILQVMAEDDDLTYVVPEEGSLVWQDTLCIPKGAPHPKNANTFINYILDAKVGASIADFIQYATPNAAAKALMDEAYTQNPAIFPSEATLARCESAVYRGEKVTRMIDEAWTKILAA